MCGLLGIKKCLQNFVIFILSTDDQLPIFIDFESIRFWDLPFQLVNGHGKEIRKIFDAKLVIVVVGRQVRAFYELREGGVEVGLKSEARKIGFDLKKLL
uniref:Nitro_FeMo-Co domain-containing protein n=1 Tax=Bursaphelenchus xylophilus TaxID=6326 RepID=A0A1I7SJV4_BURXY